MASGLVVPAWLQWSWLVALLLAAVGYLIFQHSRGSHTYDVNQLYHFVGQAIADPAATNRRTWLVDPATDPPQKATFGPFDIYDAGLYRVTFRLKLPEMVETDQAIAVLQVNATANFDELATQPLRFEHFAHANLYHDFVLTVNNPRRQSLSFDVQYLGIAPLIIDQVTIMEVQE